jgi:hypothetical protein
VCVQSLRFVCIRDAQEIVNGQASRRHLESVLPLESDSLNDLCSVTRCTSDLIFQSSLSRCSQIHVMWLVQTAYSESVRLLWHIEHTQQNYTCDNQGRSLQYIYSLPLIPTAPMRMRLRLHIPSQALRPNRHGFSWRPNRSDRLCML